MKAINKSDLTRTYTHIRKFTLAFGIIFLMPTIFYCQSNDATQSSSYESNYAQAKAYFEKQEFAKASTYAIEALNAYLTEEKQDPNVLLELRMAIGNYRIRGRDLDSLLEYLNETKKYCLNQLGEEHELCTKCTFAIGNYYIFGQQYNSALEHYEPAYKFYSKLDTGYTTELISVIDNIGVCKNRLNKFDEALVYGLKALNLRKQTYGLKDIQLSNSYTNLSNIYQGMKNYEKANEYYQKDIDLVKSIKGETSIHLFASYFNSAISYVDQEDYQEAEARFLRAKDLLVINKLEEHPYMNFVTNALAHIDYATEDFQAGLEKFKLLEKENYNSVSTAHGLGLCYNGLGYTSKAIQYFRNAQTLNGFDPKDPYNFDNINEAEQFFPSLDELSKIYKSKYLNSQNQLDLDTCESEFKIALEYIDYLQNNSGELANLYSTENHAGFYWNYAHLKTILSDQVGAVNILEQNKSKQILSHLNSQKVNYSGIDETTVAHLSLLNQQIRNWKSQYNSSLGINDSLAIISKDSLDYYVSVQRDALKEIELNNPEYYSLQLANEKFQIKDLQAKLREDQLVIQYALIDTALLTFSISKNKINSFYWEGNNLEEIILTANNDIINQKSTKNNLDSLSAILLNAAFSKIEEKALPAIKHLIIIPDGLISKVPFELLSLNNEQILNQFSISYAPSSKLLTRQLDIKNTAKKELACFAPKYQANSFEENSQNYYALLEREGKLNLPGAIHETTEISKIINADLYQQEIATKEKFLEVASQYNILHFAMHSEVNEKNPLYSSLCFAGSEESKDNLLYAHELYNLKLNCALVVLSACNTGYGKVNKGEGMLSVSRAFAYAGAPSSIHSLWKVPDQATSHIMTNFYNNLSKGLEKDEALRNAKVNYLEDETIPEIQKTPYHWAGFVASGNMAPISIKSEFNKWYLLVLLGIGLLLYFTKTKSTS